MSGEGLQAGAVVHVVQSLMVPISWCHGHAGGQRLSIRRKGHGEHITRLSGEGLQAGAVAHAPEFDGAIITRLPEASVCPSGEKAKE